MNTEYMDTINGEIINLKKSIATLYIFSFD